MRLLYFILLSLLFIEVTGQSPMPRVVDVDESKGLYLTDDVANVFVDTEGFVWITSFSEIVRCNGTNFLKLETAHLKHGSFLRVEETPCKEKYVIDLDGRIFFIKEYELIPYKHNDFLVEKNKLYQSIDIRFDCEKNAIVSIAGRGIWTIKNGMISQQKLGNDLIYRWVLLEEGLPLISLSDYRNPITHFDTDSNKYRIRLRLYSKEYNLLDSNIINRNKFHRHFFQSVVELANGNLLATSFSNYLIEFDNREIIRTIPLIDSEEILHLFNDSKNNLWVSTWGGEVYFFKDSEVDYDNAKVYKFKEGNIVIISGEDKEGNIWGYSENSGVFKLENVYEYYYSEQVGYEMLKNIESFVKVDTLLYYQKGNNIACLNLGSERSKVFSLPEIPQEAKSKYNIKTFDNTLNSIVYNYSAKNLWFCQGRSIQFLKDNKRVFFSFEEFEYPNYYPNALKSSKKEEGFSLSGTHFNQYFRITGDTVSYISSAVEDKITDFVELGDSVFFKTFSKIFLLYQDSLYSMEGKYPLLNRKIKGWVVWNDKVWVSIPERGVYQLGKDSLEKVYIHGVSPTDARIVVQSDSSLWLFSSIGSFEIKQQGNVETTKAYNPLSRVNLTKIEIDGEELYAGTQKSGLLKVDLTVLRKFPLNTPTLQVTKVILGAEEQVLGDTPYEVDYTLNDFKVFFNGQNYSSWKTNYQYRLKGQQEKWVSTNEGKAEYSNLEPGEYKFEVQVRRGEQLWSTSEYIQLTIVPPLWKRTWFITLFMLAVGLITFLIIQNRIKRLNREKLLMISRLTAEQRALRAKMDPHFMFNVIASLQYLVNNNLNKKASIFLDQFSSLMRSTLDQTNLELISIQGEILFLKEYIQMERLRLEERFDFEIVVEKGVDETVEIPNFLIQPFVENAIHHGLKLKQSKGHLKITYSLSGKFIQVVIEDDGLGYNETKRIKTTFDLGRKSHGIATVKERLKLMNDQESVIIEDLSDLDATQTGTRVTILIKI